VADKLGRPVDEVSSLLGYQTKPISLDEAIDPSDFSKSASRQIELICDHNSPDPELITEYQLIQSELKQIMRQSGLSDQEQLILEMRYGLRNSNRFSIGITSSTVKASRGSMVERVPRKELGMTLDEVGESLGLTHQRILQVETKAIKKLRTWAKQKGNDEIFLNCLNILAQCRSVDIAEVNQ
jgi:RNA polymerase primary sigma factor